MSDKLKKALGVGLLTKFSQEVVMSDKLKKALGIGLLTCILSGILIPMFAPVLANSLDINLTLVDAHSDQDILTFYDNAVLNSNDFDSHNVNIRANFGALESRIESVVFSFDGQDISNIQNGAPYTLFGDKRGDYRSGHLADGNHVLTVTAYEKDDGRGNVISQNTFNFQVVSNAPVDPPQDPPPADPPQVSPPQPTTSLTLVDAVSDSDITTFGDGATLNADSFDQNQVNIRTNFSSDASNVIESVVFSFDGQDISNIQNGAPYTLFGDKRGDYHSGHLANGNHTLTVTAYDRDDGQGNVIVHSTFNFQVVSNAPADPPQDPPPADPPQDPPPADPPQDPPPADPPQDPPSDIIPGAYYVSPNGNNGNPGTESQPWASPQHAANNAPSGSTVIVQPGEYSGGLDLSRGLTFIAAGRVIIRGGAEVSGSGNVLRGFTIMDTQNEAVLHLSGSNNLIENNDLSHADQDGIWFFGHDNTVRGNYIHDLLRPDEGGDPHADCFQTWKSVSNYVFDSNVCLHNRTSGSNQIVMMEPRDGDITNLTFINNVFIMDDAGYSPMNLNKKSYSNDMNNITVRNNIFVNRTGDGSYGVRFINVASGSISNNVFVGYGNSNNSYVNIEGGNVNVSHNLVYKANGDAPRGGPNQGDVWMVDPRTANPASIGFTPIPNNIHVDVHSLISVGSFVTN